MEKFIQTIDYIDLVLLLFLVLLGIYHTKRNIKYWWLNFILITIYGLFLPVWSIIRNLDKYKGSGLIGSELEFSNYYLTFSAYWVMITLFIIHTIYFGKNNDNMRKVIKSRKDILDEV